MVENLERTGEKVHTNFYWKITNRRNNVRYIPVNMKINMIQVARICLGRDSAEWWALVIKAMNSPVYIKDVVVLFHLSN